MVVAEMSSIGRIVVRGGPRQLRVMKLNMREWPPISLPRNSLILRAPVSRPADPSQR